MDAFFMVYLVVQLIGGADMFNACKAREGAVRRNS